MKKKGLFYLISSVFYIASIFCLSYFSGFFIYDNSSAKISDSIENYIKTSDSKVECQKIMASNEWSIEKWQSIKENDIPINNTFSRVIRNVKVKDFDGEKHQIIAMSAESYEQSKYSTNHIYIAYGYSWKKIDENCVYISTKFANNFLLSSKTNVIRSFQDLIGKNLTFESDETNITLQIGGVFYSTPNTYANHYAACFENEEVFYMSLENSFALESNSKEGFVTYEAGSKTNFQTYSFINKSLDISKATFYNVSLESDIANIIDFYNNKNRYIYFVVLLVLDILFLIFFIKHLRRNKAHYNNLFSKSNLLKRLGNKLLNKCYLFSCYVFIVYCFLLFVIKRFSLSHLKTKIEFINEGSMTFTSLSFLLIIMVIWFDYISSKEKNIIIDNLYEIQSNCLYKEVEI